MSEVTSERGRPDTTAVEAPDPTDRVPAPRPDELATERGETVIAPAVVTAVARQAAGEVEGVDVVSKSGLRSLFSSSPVSAELASRQTAVDLHVAVHWPRPVPEVTASVRQRVRHRVQELTGYEVTDIDITVDELPRPTARRRARRVE